MTEHFNPDPIQVQTPEPSPAQGLPVYSVYCIIDNCVYYMFKNILLVIFEAFKLNKNPTLFCVVTA